jgi:hypothetical protein
MFCKNIVLAFGLTCAMMSPAVADGRTPTREPVQMAQACGWFAIYSCSTRASEVQAFIQRTGFGFMIDSSSNMFPNFRPGYFCAGDGPVTKARADSFVREAQHTGLAPTAYIKSSC